MELDECSPSIFIISFIFIAISIAILRRIRPKKTKALPPGPWKLPLIGNLHQFISRDSLPYKILRDLAQKHGPLMHLQLGEVSAVVASSPEMAKVITRTKDLEFADKPAIRAIRIVTYDYLDIAFNSYGKYWREMRKIFVQELLTPKRVRSFWSAREDVFSNLVKTINSANGKSINLTKLISSTTNSIINRVALGNVPYEREIFMELIKQLLTAAGGFKLVDLFPSYKIIHVLEGTERKLWKILGKIDKILDKVIDEHRENLLRTGKGSGENGQEDIVDILLKIEDGGELDHDIPFGNNNIKALLFDIISGGSDTSSTTIDWAMSEMMKNPQVMSKAQKEIREAFNGKKKIDENDVQNLKYLKSVIQETLRLHPPAAFLMRQCREECEIGGYHIPVGTKVFINIWAMGRDPEHWPNPESFIPERFENIPYDFTGSEHQLATFPFGSGRRICPGISFGLANVELSLALLLYHFNWQLPDSSTDLDMTEAIGIAARRKYDLHLIPTSYM
uniref:(+)-vincadifformine 19-hydroxylase n=1 Tax=Catharanthus roseus TaxID=4058 RepID=V19H_CATRO|nr:RecName: Full=(+)-vincadifformine 19-hydroxylase; AltName: Full=Cytochrome P450 71BY3 [Catharanthus roseus]QCZ35502.1 (+)-vincadifformine 19-hydroxylase [Catharanthus roseus]